ncbi:MAG: AI-2E family transporter [Anaerococcus sp.]|nr:AI-2E family transporter [Anaerococcus sp.]
MGKININQRALFKQITYAIVLFFTLWYLPVIKDVFLKALGLLRPFIIGAVIAYIVNIPMNFFEKNLGDLLGQSKHRKLISGLSLLISWLTIAGVTVILLNILIPRLVSVVFSVFNQWPEFVDEIYKTLSSYSLTKEYADSFYKFVNSFGWYELRNAVVNFFSGNSSTVLSATTGFLNSLGNSLISLFTVFFFSIFILVYKRMLKHNFTKIIYAILDEDKADYLNKVFSLSYNTFKEYIFSRLIAVVTLSTLTFIGMVILRLPNAGMISIFVGLSDLIPIFGPIFGAGFSSIIIFVQSPVKAIIFLVFDIIVQQIQENVIYPAIAGEQIGLPAIWVLASVTLGGSIFGIWGMLVSIPLFSIVYTLFHEYVDNRLKKKNISKEDIREKKDMEYRMGDIDKNEID